MLPSPMARMAVGLLIGMVASHLTIPHRLAAQSTSPALVVVAEKSVADCVQRIGREYVNAELLFAAGGAAPCSYEDCAKRIRTLLGFRLLVVRSDADCPSVGFWRDRMAAANPQGKVHRISLPPSSAAGYSEVQIQQATAVHRALVSILPEQRAALDANLELEIHRLNLLRLVPDRVARRE